MRLTLLLPSILAIFSCLSLFGQSVSKHTIDVELDRCLQDSSGQSTAGMRECTYAAMDAWDDAMNKTYVELMMALSPASQDSLRQAQRAWLVFRDSQFALNDQVYMNDLNGTMYHVMASYANMDVVKRRAEELRNMMEIVKLK